ncbi:MAG: 30S ribosomal protein S4 [Patescibacteria group bacterium]
MARYLGPKHHMCRRVGERLCTSDKCPLTKRNYPPGVHGVKGRSKLTGYGLQLREKQKARWIYGVLEKQFRRYYQEAIRQTGATDVVFLQLLESRLDNIVYRMGLNKTRQGARQIINHGHVEVNGKKVDIASYNLKPGDVVGVKKNSLDKAYFKNLQKSWGQNPKVYDWLVVDDKEFKAKLLALPTPEQAAQPFDMKLIVEYYSR